MVPVTQPGHAGGRPSSRSRERSAAEPPETWLVCGATGQLGRALLRHWREIGDVEARIHCVAQSPGEVDRYVVEPIDLRHGVAVSELLERIRPDRIFHCAAISRPIEADRDPDSAHALHAGATGLFSEYAASEDAWLLFCSSDIVFAGDQAEPHCESDPTCARRAYEASKLAGEQEVLSRGAGLVVRLSWMYEPVCLERPSSWREVINSLRAGRSVPGVVNELRTPLTFAEAAATIAVLADSGRRGLVNIGGLEILTPYELLLRQTDRMVTDSAIIPTLSSTFHGGTRPKNLALDTTRLTWWLAADGQADPRRRSDTLGVVIPAYRCGGVIERSLRSLATQQLDTWFPVHVVVAVNDSSAGSVAEARTFRDHLERRGFKFDVIETPVGRRAALAAAESLLQPGPRLYLDQDAMLSPGALARLWEAIGTSEAPRFATFAATFSATPSGAVRSFLRCWTRLPYFTESPVVCGAFAVSRTGRRRWAQLPPVASDDKFVRLQFAREERIRIAQESYEVLAPRTFTELVHARARYHRSNIQLASFLSLRLAVDTRRRAGLSRILAHPSSWPDATVFAVTMVLAALRARRTEAR
jgi:dTDP-4-dehydrorhamnose reductase